MDKSEFLKQISSMSRKEIDGIIKTNANTKTKLVYPVLILRKPKKKEDEK